MTRDAVDLVGTLKGDAALMIHTGDLSHLSREAQFGTVAWIIGDVGLETHYVPGEHDVPDVEAAPLADTNGPLRVTVRKEAGKAGLCPDPPKASLWNPVLKEWVSRGLRPLAGGGRAQPCF